MAGRSWPPARGWIRALAAGDVRLTMGGEPTFVAATDMEAAEWNTDALGPTKRGYAGKLIRRLATLWAPGAALHYGAGQAVSRARRCRAGRCTRIGAPMASRSGPIRRCWPIPRPRARRRHRPRRRHGSSLSLAERLQVDPATVLPAHEDVHYYLWKEHRLPANVLVEDNKLRDPLERARMVRVFGQGLAAAGRQRAAAAPRGRRRAALADRPLVLPRRHAVPGARRQPDRPAPAAGKPALGGPRHIEPSSSRPVRAARRLPPHADASAPPHGRHWPTPIPAVPQEPPEVEPEEPGLVRTALAVEPRGGIIHVFFPPLDERRGLARRWSPRSRRPPREAGRPVVLEGYLPPVRSAPAELLRHPRSRRDRGQRASRDELGRAGEAHRAALRGGPRRSAWRPRNSCWTAAMSAPAAATTW